MTESQQYRITDEPFYQPQGDEVTLYEAAYRARLPVMVKGPTGCGKSRFIEYMAWRLQRPLISVACNEDMTASDLVGRYLLDANGTRWLDGPLTTAARIGAICYLDEIVEARQDTTVVIHPLTDHRRTLPLDKRGELVAADRDFQLVISYNPGYQNIIKDLKQSTKQRFTAFEFDYPDGGVESTIVAKESGVDLQLAERLVRIAAAARNLKGHGLDEGISTRLLVYAATLIRGGVEPRAACRMAMVCPITDDADIRATLEHTIDTIFVTTQPTS
ncbi:MAG: CbbQ/NirQ/NorQ/GpvN family protein [Mariprofundales bacterium]|nr:CbbQ/NirQ/NorQ/GpvN family protein [Mariprofundales bacterium]